MKTGLATRERACDGSDGRRESDWLGEVRHASGRFLSGGQGVPVIGSPDESVKKDLVSSVSRQSVAFIF